MRRVLDIGHNELRLFLKNPGSLVWLIVLPAVFAFVFSFVAPKQGKPNNRFPAVLIENLDEGFLGGLLIDRLSAQGLWRVDPAKGEKAGRGVRIPADFTARVLAKQATDVEFFTIEGSNTTDAVLIETRVVRALLALNSDLIESGTAPGAAWPPTEASLKALRERPELVALDAKYAGRRPVPSGFEFSLPSNLVNFLMMNLLIFGGSTIAATRRSGVLKRLLTLPVRRGELVAGQIYGLVLLGAVQTGSMLLLGRFAFGINLGANLPGVLLVLFVFTWVAAALGVLVGSLLDAQDRIIGVCVFASLITAAIGGCWFPLEIMPEAMKVVALCVPTGWAISALNQLISFGSGIDAVVVPVLVLMGFALAATAAAARFFRV